MLRALSWVVVVLLVWAVAKLSYTAKVQGNGNLLVGKAYTAMLGLEPGAEFDIKLGKKAIRLIPVGGSEEESEE